MPYACGYPSGKKTAGIKEVRRPRWRSFHMACHEGCKGEPDGMRQVNNLVLLGSNKASKMRPLLNVLNKQTRNRKAEFITSLSKGELGCMATVSLRR